MPPRPRRHEALPPKPSAADRALIAAARAAARRAYAPYSRFHVGAALRGRSGKIYTGCNYENASSPISICAERVAIGNAIAQGERRFTSLAVAVRHPVPAMPCGACRQALVEFTDTLPVWSVGARGAPAFARLEDLLPHRFHLPRRR